MTLARGVQNILYAKFDFFDYFCFNVSNEEFFFSKPTFTQTTANIILRD